MGKTQTSVRSRKVSESRKPTVRNTKFKRCFRSLKIAKISQIHCNACRLDPDERPIVNNNLTKYLFVD